MDKLNTHYYDGKLGDSKLEIKDYLDRISAVPKDEKLKALETFKKLPLLNSTGRNNLTTIINDYRSSNGGGNFDPTSGLSAHDLLYILYLIRINDKTTEERTKDLDSLLVTQLTEMSGGMCPQGRTHRLLQVVLANI